MPTETAPATVSYLEAIAEALAVAVGLSLGDAREKRHLRADRQGRNPGDRGRG